MSVRLQRIASNIFFYNSYFKIAPHYPANARPEYLFLRPPGHVGVEGKWKRSVRLTEHSSKTSLLLSQGKMCDFLPSYLPQSAFLHCMRKVLHPYARSGKGFPVLAG